MINFECSISCILSLGKYLSYLKKTNSFYKTYNTYLPELSCLAIIVDCEGNGLSSKRTTRRISLKCSYWNKKAQKRPAWDKAVSRKRKGSN